METIEDIIRDIRENDGMCISPTSLFAFDEDGGVLLGDLAERLEAAYNRQRRDGSLCTMSCRESGELLNQYMEENKRLHEENKRLRTENERLKVCKDFLYT